MSKVFTICPGLENMGAVKSGGQGSVFKGKRIGELNTAIKILPTPVFLENETDKNYRDFQNEVEKLLKVNEQACSNVVRILSSGITESGSFPFIEMEFIEGPGLEDLLKAPHPPVFTLEEVISVAEQLASALAHCHAADVRHGDIKSNNIKFNQSTGRYVLLDFGMAIMSDEQRRTSLRYAGAIEFMAPEQNEGLIFFQTDIYSYGIVLYELLAGTVPFVLKDKSGTARNKVMLAHMEAALPDVVSQRLKNLPNSWTEGQKESEMNVPSWLTALLVRCLEKNPFDRFENGQALYSHIIEKRTESREINAKAIARLAMLTRENERLKSLVLNYQEKSRLIEQKHEEAVNIRQLEELPMVANDEESAIYFPQQKNSFIKRASVPIVCCSLIAVICFLFFNNHFVKSQSSKLNQEELAKTSRDSVAIIQQFKVKTPKAYFHNNADPRSKRNAYLLRSEQVLTPLKDSNSFVYIEFVNAMNKRSRGWLRIQDLEAVNGYSAPQR